jgi:hypothetical protein
MSKGILGTVGTYHMEQRRVVVGVKTAVELAHKGGLVDKCEAPYGVDVGKVVLYQAAYVPGSG